MKRYFSILLLLFIALAFYACGINPTSPSSIPGLQELTVESDGITLNVRVAGDPASGNVLIAIHGGPGMTLDYMLNLETLAGPDLAIVTYDQRGVGRSSSPAENPANYTLARYAQDLDAVRQAIGVEQVTLFGHSWGGILAQRYATFYPEHVTSIILIGSGPPTWEKMLQCQDALMQRFTALVQQGIIVENPEPGSLEAERGHLPAYFSDPGFWFSPDDLGSAPLIDERTPRVTDLTWTVNAGYNLTADLAGLKLHVLNLWGEDDPVRPISSPEIIAALSNADVETVVFSHCGHFWHECPEQFFPTLRAFLDIQRDK
jgi:pimeloyl-ACP methyl ester carboxylesterase